jgi:DNA invertase Pin-like site-specific DNA recombinase
LTDAYLYVRFSSSKQEDGSSRDRQLQDGRALIERMGWTEVELIEDLGRSAWKGDHLTKGNLGKFAKRIVAGEIPPGSVIVVEELDRLSRQKARVTQRWIEDVCDTGVKIATVRGGRVYDADNLTENLMNIFEVLMKAQAAWEYVERLAYRVKRSYDERLKQARIDNTAIGTVGPAWLKAVGKRPNVKWETIPERVKIVREIFDMAVAGKAPWAIAKEFNDRGELSFTGIKWERTSIVKILRNRAIDGDYVIGEGKNQKPTGEVLLGYYKTGEPIVPLDVVAEARAMLDRRSIRKGKGRNSGKITNLFGQKLRCGECGGRMMTTGEQSRYLTCYEAQRSSSCSNKRTYRYRPFEGAALDSILHLALDETFFRQAQKSNHIGVEIAGVEKAIRDRTAETVRLWDILKRIESPTGQKTLEETEIQIRGLKSKLVGLNAERAMAQGAASAEAHLARIHRIRDALSHPDDEVRLPARLRVSEAVQSVLQTIRCEIFEGEKRFELILNGGIYAARFDNDGHIVAEVRGSVEVLMAESGGGAKALARRVHGGEPPTFALLSGEIGQPHFHRR